MLVGGVYANIVYIKNYLIHLHLHSQYNECIVSRLLVQVSSVIKQFLRNLKNILK